MREPWDAAAHRTMRRRGFTIFEAVIVLLIVATIVGALTPSVSRQISHARVNRAANIVAADFLLAQSLAGRHHKPVRLTFSSTAKTTTVADPTSTTLLTRRFGADSDFMLQTFSATTTSVLVLPSGMANTSVTVTVSSLGYTRQVRMTRAGQVRVL